MRSKDYRSAPITRSPHACPKCGSVRVRRSKNYLVHLWRRFHHSRKRYCVHCGERWCASLMPEAPSLLRARDLVIPGLVLIGLLGVAAVSVLPRLNPVRWVKTNVRGYYDRKYGQESEQRLMKHWGWLYGSGRDAQRDYQAHPDR